jgi:hypothetical protein
MCGNLSNGTACSATGVCVGGTCVG